MRAKTTWTILLMAAAGASGCSCGEEPPADPGCAGLACAPHQICAPGPPASCAAACEAGWSWSGTGCVAAGGTTCLPAPAAGSILATCSAQNRSCSEAGGTAACGACATGFVEVAGACEAARSCAELGCDRQGRSCVEEPNGRCDACLPGLVEDAPAAACRPRRTCDQLTCMAGETCVESATTDAICRAGGCQPGEVPRARGQSCIRCNLDCSGRAGGTGQIYSTVATLADTCVCETLPGFFWDEGAGGGGDIRPCDDDGDGWVRINAQKPLDNQQDLALRSQARCEVRRIDRFVLENDFAEQREIALPAPLALYEPERSDDQRLIDDAVALGRLATYGGRTFLAEELNSLTKACVWKTRPEQSADFNDNGVEDVDEGHDDPALDDPIDPLSPFADFAYFIETHRGWFEPPGANLHGSYRIREKSRLAAEPDPAQRLALGYPPSAGGDHWRRCDRFPDSSYVAGRPGFDFAQYDDPQRWRGMGHHSQFRCLRLVGATSGRSNEVTRGEAAAEWVIQRCLPAGGSNPAPDLPGLSGGNPSDPQLGCQDVLAADLPDPQTSSTAPIFMAAARYLPHDDDFTSFGRPDYVRGCVNECATYPFRCPGYEPLASANTAQCVGDLDDFGRLSCGCGKSFAGAGCQIACPGDLTAGTTGELFTSADLDLAPRTGWWLCGRGALSVGGPQLQTTGSTLGLSLRGEIPASNQPHGAWCSSPDCTTGFSLRAAR